MNKCDVEGFNCPKYSPGNQVGGLPGALHSMKFCDENQKLFVRSQLWANKFTKGDS